MRKRRKAKKPARPNKRRSRTAATATENRETQTQRTIGQIIVDGPRNQRERRKLNLYRQKRDAFYAANFSHLDIKQHLIRSAVDQSLRALSLIRSEYRHAIQTQHLSESRPLLERIARKAKELLEQGKVQSDLASRATSGSTPESTQLIGAGGFPANSCQLCGRYLTKLCYSQIYNANRVPRTDKICPKCFSSLPRGEKQSYHKYQYGHRAEPRGVGWKPEGEWGN